VTALQPPLVARVVPDVSGLDKQFDYLVPDQLAPTLAVGDIVRVPLHGRRVRGWVVRLGPPSADTPVERLVALLSRSGHGPAAEVVELAHWAAWRWGSDHVQALLTSASPHRNVPGLPSPRRTVDPSPGPAGVVLHRVAPLTDPMEIVLDVARRGPVIAIHPSVAGAGALGRRLARRGLAVAVLPDDWAAAAAGVDVVVGGRAAVWAPCPGLTGIVVLDEHDESLQEERSPTWHARDVAVERAARAGAQVALVSPAPTLTARHLVGAAVQAAPEAERRRGWPEVEVVDRSDADPWRRSLVTTELVAHLRSDARVACVHNVPGRSRLLACRACRALQRCTVCDASVALDDDGRFRCGRCGADRPPGCQSCGSSAMANVRPGITRLRDELEAAAGRPVVAVSASQPPSDGADVYVGTEAVLHRVRDLDVVVFLDLDHELLAPRYRAAEHTLALLVRAARLVGGRRDGARLVLQTHQPDHPLVDAVRRADPSLLDPTEERRRRQLGLPPFGAIASITGETAGAYAASCGLAAAGAADDVLVRADDWAALADALATPRPRGSRLRVEVDPPRR
jgi:primosomal protein N' (replication factor Y)